MSATLMLIDAVKEDELLLLLLPECKGLPGVLSINFNQRGTSAMPITFVTTVKKIANPMLACGKQERTARKATLVRLNVTVVAGLHTALDTAAPTC